jgi:hypothetical protein
MLSQGMFRVRAQTALGLLASLLSVALEAVCAALVVDVAAGLAGLRIGLPLGLGGLAALVGGGHFCLCCDFGDLRVRVRCERGDGWEAACGDAYGREAYFLYCRIV